MDNNVNSYGHTIIGGIKMNKKGQMEFSVILLITILLFAFIWAISSFSIIEYNEYGVIKSFSGKIDSDIRTQGWTNKGMFGSVIRVNNQIRNHQITIEASSKDLQKVKLILNVNMQIKTDKVFDFVKNYKDEQTYTDYLNNKMQENIKIDVLKYNVLDFVNNRSEVSKDIKADVQGIPELNYFDIKDISIVNIKYSDELEKVLEQKGQVLIEREVIQRQKENIELINENMKLTNMDDYFKYKIAEKWDGTAPLTIIGD